MKTLADNFVAEVETTLERTVEVQIKRKRSVEFERKAQDIMPAREVRDNRPLNPLADAFKSRKP